MNRVGSFAVAYAQADVENKTITGDRDLSGFGFTHMKPDSPLFLNFSYITSTTDYKFKPGYSFIDYSVDLTATSVTIGYFVKQNTVFALEYETGKYEYSPTAYSDFDYTEKQTNLLVKHLVPSGGDAMLNIEGILGKTTYEESTAPDTDNTVMGLEVDFYPNTTASIGGIFEQTTGDDNGFKGREIGLRGQIFLTPKFSVTAEISQFTGKGSSDDNDGFSLSANLRM